MHEVFQTSRLRLRQWKDADRKPFAEMNNDVDVMRYFPQRFTAEQSNSFIDNNFQQIAQHGWGAWAVETIDQARFIGFVGFSHPANWHPCAGNIDIGWRIDKRYWNHGYATEAAAQALDIGFDWFGFTDLVSFTSKCNFPSVNVMKKIGMHKSSVEFDHPYIDSSSRLRRHVIYGLTQDDWRTRE